MISSVLEAREHQEQGKSPSNAYPRTTHPARHHRLASPNAVALLEKFHARPNPALVSTQFGRLAQSPFHSFRGTAIIQVLDLINSPASESALAACGYCYQRNFGGFAMLERTLVFDINGLDKAFPASGNGTSSA